MGGPDGEDQDCRSNGKDYKRRLGLPRKENSKPPDAAGRGNCSRQENKRECSTLQVTPKLEKVEGEGARED